VSKTWARKIKTTAGQIREEEATAQLTSFFNSIHQEAFDAGREQVCNPFLRDYHVLMVPEAQHKFEQDLTKLEEETAAIIQAVIDSYKDCNMNTNADESVKSSMTAEEINLIEQVLHFFVCLKLFQLSD